MIRSCLPTIALAAALIGATTPARAMLIGTYAVYYQGTSNHCVVHFSSGNVVDMGWMPLSVCQGIVNFLN